MASLPLESLSTFGRLAVQLDGNFSEMVRLSEQMQRLDIDSDSGLERAIKLLNQFAQHGQDIAGNIQDFSKSLEEARDRSEAAAKLVAERARHIEERTLRQNQIQEKLKQVEEKVKTANAQLAESRKQGKPEFLAEEKTEIMSQLERLNSELVRFIAETQAVKEEAGQGKFKRLEHDAQSIIDTLQSSRRKINSAISAK
jgi:predicted  nucleic acid-binding Zn-ribbon protein